MTATTDTQIKQNVSMKFDASRATLPQPGMGNKMGWSNRPVGHKAEPTPVGGPLKRAIDLCGGVAALILFAPLMLVVAVALCFEGGPIFFGHKRIGFNGREFRCLKFRSMVVNGDEVLEKHLAQNPEARKQWEEERKLDNDPRVTSIGSFLRVTSLDELPQVFNVLRGDMSLVGPRPVTRDEAVRYGEKFEDYKRCRPGITGAWQVSGRNDVSYAQRVNLDSTYSREQSFFGDVGILTKTVGVVLLRKGAK